jgi:outer membrane receptor protein involved in Fe transport
MVRGALSYRSETISETFIDQSQRQGGYTLYDASAQLSWDNGFDLALRGRNLGDKDYCLYKQANNASISTFVGVNCLAAPGSEIEITVSYRFD